MKNNILLFVFLLMYFFVNSQDKDKDGVLDIYDECPEVSGVASLKGCPKAKERVRISEEHVTNCGQHHSYTIYFDFKKAVYSKESKKTLKEALLVLKNFPKEKFIVEAHTDNLEKPNGIEAIALSEKRAKRVVKYLVKKGIPSSCLIIKAYGDAYPIMDNNTAIGRAYNRRVEFRLKK